MILIDEHYWFYLNYIVKRLGIMGSIRLCDKKIIRFKTLLNNQEHAVGVCSFYLHMCLHWASTKKYSYLFYTRWCWFVLSVWTLGTVFHKLYIFFVQIYFVFCLELFIKHLITIITISFDNTCKVSTSNSSVYFYFSNDDIISL